MFIERAYVFKGMDKEFMEQVSEVVLEEAYSKGELLFQEGESANFFYILQSGTVRIRLGHRGHLSHVVTNSGEAFGWSSLLGRSTYSAGAECIADAQVMKIRTEEINQIFENNPANGLVFFRRLAELISRKLTESYKLFLVDHNEAGPSSYG